MQVGKGLVVDGFPASYDRVWYHRHIIHECTAVFMWQYVPNAPLWPLEEAPRWFIEGLQEFVAVERAPSKRGTAIEIGTCLDCTMKP